MKYRILLDAFTLRRDVAMNYVLSKLLEQAGCEVVIACCRNFRTYLRSWRPHVAVVAVPGRIKQIVDGIPDVCLVFFPGEGGEPIETMYENKYFKEETKDWERIDKYLFWGEYSRRNSESLIPGFAHRNVVVGNPRLDLLKYNPKLDTRKSSAKKTIGFISRFPSLNNFKKANNVLMALYSDIKLDDTIRQCKQYFLFYKIIEHLMNNSSYSVSIRPHPLEAPEGYMFLKEKFMKDRIDINESIDFSSWVLEQEVIFSPATTGFIEPYLARVPLINVDSIMDILPRHDGYFAALAHKVAFSPKSDKEVFAMIEKNSFPATDINQEVEEHLKDVHNWNSNSASAIMNTRDAILKAAHSHKWSLSRKSPKTIADAFDWYHFTKSCLADRYHPNFNYKSGWHKIPIHLDQIVSNIISANR